MHYRIEKFNKCNYGEKGKGVLTPKLRTICPLEAYFNFNKTILAIYLMQFAEIRGNFPKEQYGTRKKIHYACIQ